MSDSKLGTTGLSIHNDRYPLIYRGKVLSNTDPLQAGRVKIQVYPMFAGITDADLLPWAIPMYPIFTGSGSGIGYFAVPDVGTHVFVMFEQGDFYQPIYIGEAPDALKGLPATRTTNYPKTRVIRMSSGIEAYLDDMDHVVKITHPTGSSFLMTKDGDINITATKDINIIAGHQMFLVAGGSEIYIDPYLKVNGGLMMDFASNLSSWATSFTGTGGITQAISKGLSVYKMTSGGGLGSLAGMVKGVPTLTNQFTSQLNLSTSKLGSLVNGDFLSTSAINSAVKSTIGVDAQGILVNRGGIFERVYSGAMTGDLMKTLQISVDQSMPGAVLDIVMNDQKIASSIPCVSDVGSFTKSMENKLTSTTESNLSVDISKNLVMDGLLTAHTKTIVDYIEYATDAAAQAAYVTDGTEVVNQQQITTLGSETLGNLAAVEYREAQSFTLPTITTISAVEVRAGVKVGLPTGNWTLRIETDSAGVPSGTLASANASVVVTPPADNTVVKGTFVSSFILNPATTYWLVVECSNQTAGNYWTLSRSTSDVYLNGNMATKTGGVWAANVLYDLYFKVYEHLLQCYSEPTIIAQGYYALKAVALVGSLNNKLTHIVSPTVDFTGLGGIKFDIYSFRTGSNIKVGVHNGNGALTEVTPNILVSNQWQTVTVDLTGVPDADKNAIDIIYVTVVDDAALNMFYIDNMLEAWGM